MKTLPDRELALLAPPKMRLLFVLILVSACGVASGGGQAPTTLTKNGRVKISLIETAVVREMNRLRRNPRRYAALLKQYQRYYKGRLLTLPGKMPIMTIEGRSALNGAIRALGRAKRAPPLRISHGMSRAARDHVRDLGPKGRTGHYGSDGSDPFKRLERHGQWLGEAAENIQFGARSAQEVVILLTIDDGVRDRGHRKTLLNSAFKRTGIACGRHARFRTICVITFATGFRNQ